MGSQTARYTNHDYHPGVILDHLDQTPAPPFRGWQHREVATKAADTQLAVHQANSRDVFDVNDGSEGPELTFVSGQYNPRIMLAQQQLVGKMRRQLYEKYFGPGKTEPSPALRNDP